ncbi:MAG: hypothetical protein K0S93_90 [Nitrososphaeraceae archaeon]|jgi:hypothetical protein|nr:hypothetical protein [Nitrososphaeraceae archaeon]
MKDISPYENMSEEQLKELADKKAQEAWDNLGFGGKPKFLCIHCYKPCEYDELNNNIECKKCDLNWTLESMKKDCERMLEE